MSARSRVQRPPGMAGDSLATGGDEHVAMPASDPRDHTGQTERDPHETRVSPDPMQGTDRYRLVMPFTLRL